MKDLEKVKRGCLEQGRVFSVEGCTWVWGG